MTAGGQGGGTSSTGATECTPGEMGACYSGPRDQGSRPLRRGTRTCKDDGTFGPCVGEVTPTAETCSTMGDDNCNGKVNESGSDCVCVPGATVPCYSGPATSVGIGICKAGVQTCKPDGLGLGPCQGEVVPAAEDCLAPADEDCDGTTLMCTGNQLWAKRYGDAAAQTGTGVAAKGGGGAVFVGSFAGATNFGGGVLTSAGATDVYLASVDSLGLPSGARASATSRRRPRPASPSTPRATSPSSAISPGRSTSAEGP